MIKNIYTKPTDNTIITGEKLEAFLLTSGTKRCPFSPFLLNIIMEALANAIKQEKEIKSIWIEKEEINVFVQG